MIHVRSVLKVVSVLSLAAAGVMAYALSAPRPGPVLTVRVDARLARSAAVSGVVAMTVDGVMREVPFASVAGQSAVTAVPVPSGTDVEITVRGAHNVHTQNLRVLGNVESLVTVDAAGFGVATGPGCAPRTVGGCVSTHSP